MPRRSQQKLKLLYIQKALLENTDEDHGLTVAQLQDMLSDHGISAERKSIYDDITELRDFGMDIELKHGKSSTYHVLNRDFQLPELKLLVDSVQASKFITEKKSEELIKKLERLTSRYQAQKLNRQVETSNRIKTENESIYYAVDCIHEAINNNRQIIFQYFDWTPQKEKKPRHNGKTYLVSPYAVTLSEEKYYLIAYDEDAKLQKTYRVDKIVSPKCTEYKRNGADVFKDFDVAQYANRSFGMFGGREITVELQCNNDKAGVIIDRFGEDIPFTNLTDNTFNIHVKVHDSPTFYSWLATFSNSVAVISPESVKIGYMEHLRKILTEYDRREGYSSDVKPEK